MIGYWLVITGYKHIFSSPRLADTQIVHVTVLMMAVYLNLLLLEYVLRITVKSDEIKLDAVCVFAMTSRAVLYRRVNLITHLTAQRVHSIDTFEIGYIFY